MVMYTETGFYRIITKCDIFHVLLAAFALLVPFFLIYAIKKSMRKMKRDIGKGE
jgi:hypothetical protein